MKTKNSWINAITNKPRVDTKDNFNYNHQISEKVVVWLEGEESPNFGTYNYKINHWNVEGRLGFDQSKVKFFMYLETPYK